MAAARTAEAITASGNTRRPAVVDKIQRFKFGGDGDPVEASFADCQSVGASWQHSSFDFSTVALSASMFGEF